MAQKFSRKFYNSMTWKKLATNYRQEHFHICEECGAVGASEVHHVIELTPTNISDPLISLNPDNLKLLCHACHDKQHNRFATTNTNTNKQYVYDEQGHIIRVLHCPPAGDNNKT